MAYVPDIQLRLFWEGEVEPIVKRLIAGQYQVPEVQQRYFSQLQLIVAKYGCVLNMTMHDQNPLDKITDNSSALPVGCRLNEGRPELALFVVALRLIWREMKKHKYEGYRRRYETFIVVSIMHELDHLVFGIINAPSIERLIDEECRAWASTCENTARPIAETHRMELDHNTQTYYSKWVECGRNVNSQRWIEFITSLYGSLQRG